MNIPWQTIIWQQFGAAIDDLDNALRTCPDELWHGRLGEAFGETAVAKQGYTRLPGPYVFYCCSRTKVL